MAANFPRRLSETGLFESATDHQLVRGAIPYSVNVPLWSDGADKDRYLALPAKKKVQFHETDKWAFPVGTVVVKTFCMDTVEADPSSRRRLETRLLVHGERGWEGYTYLWNDEQTDAELQSDTSLTKTYTVQTAQGPEERTWYFPSRSDCMACHTQAAGFVLGINTRQMNRVHDYGHARDNQLRALKHVGVFSRKLPDNPGKLEAFPEWGSKSAPAETLARAYLHVNCATCHVPDGGGNARADFRYQTPLTEMYVLAQEPSPLRLGPPDAHLVMPRPQPVGTLAPHEIARHAANAAPGHQLRR